MKIIRLVTSSRGHLLACIGGGLYVSQVSSMELAVCKKVKEGYRIIKTVLAGFVMKEHNDFVRAVEILKEKDLPKKDKKQEPAPEKKTFGFTFEFLYHTDVNVEADTLEEALEKVREMSAEEIVGDDFIPAASLEDGQPVSAWDEQGNDLTEKAGI